MNTEAIARIGSLLSGTLIMILAGLVSVGCVIDKKEQVVVQEITQQDVEAAKSGPTESQEHAQQLVVWRQGEAAFQKGQYQKAQETFKNLSQRAIDEDLRRKALYAFACTQFMMADDAKTYQEALYSWERWEKSAPSRVPHEDPRMVTPFLKRIPQSLPSHQEEAQEVELLKHKIEALEEIHRTLDYAIWSYWRGSAPTDVLLEDPLMVTPRLQDIPQLLHRQQEEIQRLGHQIEALEEIDRTIEEKKRGVASD